MCPQADPAATLCVWCFVRDEADDADPDKSKNLASAAPPPSPSPLSPLTDTCSFKAVCTNTTGAYVSDVMTFSKAGCGLAHDPRTPDQPGKECNGWSYGTCDLATRTCKCKQCTAASPSWPASSWQYCGANCTTESAGVMVDNCDGNWQPIVTAGGNINCESRCRDGTVSGEFPNTRVCDQRQHYVVRRPATNGGAACPAENGATRVVPGGGMEWCDPGDAASGGGHLSSFDSPANGTGQLECFTTGSAPQQNALSGGLQLVPLRCQGASDAGSAGDDDVCITMTMRSSGMPYAFASCGKTGTDRSCNTLLTRLATGSQSPYSDVVCSECATGSYCNTAPPVGQYMAATSGAAGGAALLWASPRFVLATAAAVAAGATGATSLLLP